MTVPTALVESLGDDTQKTPAPAFDEDLDEEGIEIGAEDFANDLDATRVRVIEHEFTDIELTSDTVRKPQLSVSGDPMPIDVPELQPIDEQVPTLEPESIVLESINDAELSESQPSASRWRARAGSRTTARTSSPRWRSWNARARPRKPAAPLTSPRRALGCR